MSLLKSNLKLSLSLTGGASWKRNSLMSFDIISGFAAPGYLIPKNMQNHTNTTAKVYYIDNVIITGDKVAVDYTLNDEWLEITLSYTELKQFALNRSLNDFILDYMKGEHIQENVRFDMDTFLTENLNDVIKTYLEAYPLESAIVKLNALAKDVLMYSPLERGA